MCWPVASLPLVPAGSDFAHEHQVGRIWVQRAVDQLVGDIGAVILRGVDVIDAKFRRAAEDLQRLITIFGWSEHATARELHSAETDGGDVVCAESPSGS